MAGANNDYPLLDGFSPSWADAIVKISPDGAPVLRADDIKSINSGSTVEVGIAKAGGRPKSTTVGELSHEASMTLYYTAAVAFERALKNAAVAAGLTRNGGVAQLSLVFFSITYMFTPPGSSEIYERRLKGVRLLSDSDSASEGTDALTVEYKLHVTERVKVVDGVEVSLL